MIFFIILFIMIFSNNLFPVNVEFSFGGGAGSSAEFSYVEFNEPSAWLSEEGSRTDDGVSASAFLDIGYNFKLQNAGL